MSRENKNSQREKKFEPVRRDAASSESRFQATSRTTRLNYGRNDLSHIHGLNQYRLNDLYERSSI